MLSKKARKAAHELSVVKHVGGSAIKKQQTGVAKLTRAERKAAATLEEMAGALQSKRPVKANAGSGHKVSPSHAGVIAAANGYASCNASSEPSPDILGVGTASANKRVFSCKGKTTVVTNTQGFGYWAAEATGWIPNDESEVSEPATAYIGGPGLAAEILRGPFIHYTKNQGYIGATATAPFSTNVQVPVSGTPLMDPTTGLPAAAIPAGIGFQTLPPFFVSNQPPVDADSIEASQTRPVYTLSHLSARIEPDGYVTGSADAINVVSGTVQAISYTAGDNRLYNPFSATAISATAGTDSAAWTAELPPHVLKWDELSVSEWKKGDSLHVFAVPNTSTALGAWPATLLAEDPVTGAITSSLTSTVTSPQIMFIITGAQPGQKFVVHWRVNVTASGVETYDESADSTQNRKPVDGGMLTDVLLRTLPKHAEPKLLGPDKSHPAGVMAFAQHLEDTEAVPTAAIPSFVKQAGRKAEDQGHGIGIGEVIAEIGLGLLGALL